MMMRSNRTKRGGRGKKKAQRQVAVIDRSLGQPPPIHYQRIRRNIVRVTTSNADANLDQLTVTQLAQLMGITALTSTTSQLFASVFKIEKIEAWMNPPAAADIATLALKWVDAPLAASIGIANISEAVTDTSSSLDKPAHVVLRAKGRDYANNWLMTNCTQTILSVTQNSTAGNGNATIDFHFAFILDDVGSPPGGPTIVSGSSGAIYHKILTGTAGLVYTAVQPLNSI